MTEFAESEGFAFTVDGGGTIVTPSGAGSPPTLADIQAECAAEGSTECEVVVTREAAFCISDGEGLGVDGRTADIVYNHEFEAIIWSVMAVDHETGATSGGSGLSIHAETGEVLEAWEWERMP